MEVKPVTQIQTSISLATAHKTTVNTQAKSPTPITAVAFVDRCVNKMGASPEYAWAMANPEEKIIGDALTQAQSGILQTFAWPRSPYFDGQRVVYPGSPGPQVPIGESLDQRSNDTFQTEAVTLAGAYRERHAQLLSNGSSEAEATAGAVSEVKADARTWCVNILNPASFQN